MTFEKNAKALFAKLGIKVADLEKEDFNAAETSKTVVDAIIDNNKGDIEIEAKKAGATGAYAKVTKQLANALGLDFGKYEKLDKKQFDTALDDAAKLLKETPPAEPKAAAGSNDALLKQLKDLQDMHAAAVAENKTFKAQIEGLPAEIETAKKSVIVGYEKNNHINKTMAELYASGLDKRFTPKMLLAELSDVADLQPLETNDGIAWQVVDKNGKPIKKSASEAYTNLADFMKDKVIKEDWIMKTATPTTTTTQGAPNPAAPTRDISKILPAGAGI